ncbi:MAG TPA: haloacid dehalogenase [Lachnospiraceae bacterium]|nr:haloacid dehalogenase [Lachnospiraceae bacterium]
MYKAVIFDFDYTLGDSTNGIVLSINHALEKLNLKTQDTKTIQKTIGLSLKDTLFELSGIQDEEAVRKFTQYFKEKADEVMVDNTRFYDGALEGLEKLGNEERLLGIVTTKYHYRIEQILAKNNAMNVIDVIVGGDDVKKEKPDPEGLLAAIEKLNVSKDRVLYVGDSIVDAKTAQSAGVDFVAVLTGTTKREEFLDYAHVAVEESVRELYSKY